ncbi:hypothetical protein GALL_404980 [mine drainage metagenome]|uniref:EF-hand domain-containing protein n=1 Tax=mine drainage metagenome TaxID=410659 RepID=A0A1J5Q3B8_9ZZZZ
MSEQSMRFFRAGGFDQVRIESGADILALKDLDQKLWVALACPVEGLEFDRDTLRMLDRDHDGRVRAADLLAEIAWLEEVLLDPEELVRPGTALRLAAIREEAPQGARILASARRILGNLGKGGAAEIGLADVLDTETIFNATSLNGDGVVPVEAAGDDAVSRALIEDIIACLGAETDRSGAPGVGQGKVEAFFGDLERLTAWREAEDGLEGDDDGAEALLAVREKIDGFFLRCRLAAYRGEAVATLNPGPELLGQLADKDLAGSLELLEPLPLAEIAAQAALSLDVGVNPAWSERLERFRRLCAQPMLGGGESLSAEGWAEILRRYAPRLDWRAARPETPVAALGWARLREIAAGNGKAALDALIAADLALEDEMAAIQEVERLIRLKLGLHRLLDNFVSFREFYAGRKQAVFLAGTLYLDGRSADLCIRVGDVAAHAVLATLSQMYLVYCACRRQGSDEKMTIAAAFTAGDSDQLMVGRNGVFYSRDGRDWDATIVRIIDHPISLRQAFWSPYRKAGRLINEQLEKLAALQALPSSLVPPAEKKAAAAPFDVGRFAGIFAAIGLAVGAIGTALASVVTGFLRLAWWQMPLALAGLALAVSGPAMLVAYLKLRQRSLAPVLDATGWAVNARVRINVPFGGSLTTLAHLPEDAERALGDPFAEKRRPWGLPLFLAAAALVAAAVWRSGVLTRFLN